MSQRKQLALRCALHAHTRSKCNTTGYTERHAAMHRKVWTGINPENQRPPLQWYVLLISFKKKKKRWPVSRQLFIMDRSIYSLCPDIFLHCPDVLHEKQMWDDSFSSTRKWRLLWWKTTFREDIRKLICPWDQLDSLSNIFSDVPIWSYWMAGCTFRVGVRHYKQRFKKTKKKGPRAFKEKKATLSRGAVVKPCVHADTGTELDFSGPRTERKQYSGMCESSKKRQ